MRGEWLAVATPLCIQANLARFSRRGLWAPLGATWRVTLRATIHVEVDVVSSPVKAILAQTPDTFPTPGV